MPKKRTKQQKIKAQQRRPSQVAMIQSQYQFISGNDKGVSSSAASVGSQTGIHFGKILRATDLFRYDTHLIYRDIMKTVVITITMIIALVIISRFIR
jgi:hypothetical protein